MNIIEATERNISDLFLDGIMLGMEAERQEFSLNDFSNSLSRGSLLSAFCFIEASANVCLESLNLGGQLEDDIDRIPTLSKFDLYLRLRFKNRKLDRGAFPAQGARELKTIRDAFVHPKGHKVLWEEMADGSRTSESPRTKTLSLPKVAAYFGPDDAIISLQATHRFLNYFFKDICKFSPIAVSRLLFSEDPIPPSSDVGILCLEKPVKQWVLKHKIPIEYMRLV